MRSKTIFGALLVSVALCSQGFGFELLDRMLGLNCGGCGDYKACAKVAPCDPCAKVACPDPAACENVAACGSTCSKCKKCRATPVRDLFAGMVDLFECKGVTCDANPCDPANACCPEPVTCEKACDPACAKPCKVKKFRKQRCAKVCDPCCPATCDPACEKVAACDPACEKVAACEPTCEPACKPKCHKLYRRPVVELLEALFGGRNCRCGKAACGDGCETACGSGGVAPGVKAPAKAPEKAAPLPMAPKADPSAAVPTRGIYQASRSLVRN
ncbi:MAG: hypothetical protein KKE86_00445 [Planctomycetes bacterium]|nr:hypothetical protein [Planctomycetota bacterium]MBU4397779.1 hypothetical protein [Planctomycetota bacterium]MCG2682424.1 hypothetical protein [Planctomycetales bacterium]